MQVIQVTQFGGPEVLVPVDVLEPIAGPGEAVINVAAADVLFLDIMIRSGLAAEFFPLRPPYLPGGGVAGTVISVGPGTDSGWIGRQVVAHTGAGGGSGGYAQRAVVAGDDLVPAPVGLAAFGSIAVGGRFSAHGAPAGGFTAIDPTEVARLGVALRGIEQVQFSPSDRVRLTGEALDAAAAGLIRPVIGQTFPLEEAVDAHRAIEARAVIGKTLLVI